MRDLSLDPTHLFAGENVQLLLDNLLIETSQDLTRRHYQPKRAADAPLIERDKPWEHLLYFTYSNHQVIRDPDEGLFKCWYEDLEGPDERLSSHHFNMFSRQLYAESRDGIHWEKPLLDVARHNGAPTNIVLGDPDYGQVHSCGYVIDPDAADAAQRYRAIYAHYWDRPSERGRRTECAHSPDGIHWSRYGTLPSFGRCGSRIGDVSTLYYDPESRDFVQITRHFLQRNAPANPVNPRSPVNRRSFNVPHEPHNFASYSQRRLWLTRSHDFIHWSEPVVIAATDDEEDNLDESFYGMPIFRVGRMYLGTVGVLHQVDNTMDVQLLMSRDMIRWKRVGKRQPFFAPSEVGNWDGRMVSITSAPIEVGDELWFFHGGTNYHHDFFLRGPTEGLDHPESSDPQGSNFGLGLAKLRKDGFASVAANRVREGVLCTRALYGVGNKLLINARCGEGGSIRVEVADENDEVLSSCTKDGCDPFLGDSVAHMVTWKQRPFLTREARKGPPPVCRLRFFLRNAELFSFRFEDVPAG